MLKLNLLQDLLLQQKQFTNHFFDELDLSEVEVVLEKCLACKGILVLTGVGKSGIIAEKIAMTLISTGTRAIYLPAANFLHGDIGGITNEDLVLMFSKSGQTDELLDLVPYMRKKRVPLIGIVSDRKSPLAAAVDYAVYLPVEKELCLFDLAPTTSTAVQLLFGDLLAVGLMKEKGFSIEEYAHNHPAGSIGKQIAFTVADLMKKGKELPLCPPEARLIDTIVELSNKKLGCLLVTSEDGELLGIFTDGDLRRTLEKEGTKGIEKEVGELMTRDPITLHPEDLAYTALRKMQEKRRVMIAPVLEKKKVVGLIHMHDIIQEGIHHG